MPSQSPPYSALQKNTRVQTLADGTVVTHTDEGFIARDANDRYYSETIRHEPQGFDVHYFSVTDPVKGMRFNWTVGPATAPKVVSLFHTGRPIQPAPIASNPNPQPRRYYPYRSESLPPTTINGIYVEGTRSTRITPAGYDGNDHDIAMITETWNSPDLRVVVRSIMDDPRSGKNTMELIDIQRTAPDPALFELPAGYEVKETNP